MTIHIQSDDGAVGKSLTVKRKKNGDDDRTVCEIKVQMTVNRRQFEQLAGFPEGYCNHFYLEEGVPVASLSLLLVKRELEVSGKLSRGDDEFESALPLNKATASDLHFVPEPNQAVFICKLSWRAEGDEVDEVKDLLGSFCSVDLHFKTPAEQGRLDLGPVQVETIAAGLGDVQDQLQALGFNIPEGIWSTMTPTELSRVMDYVEAREAGKEPKMPAILKPHASA